MAAANGDDLDPTPLPAVVRLAAVMKRLRGPGGCPWDAEQTEESLKKHLLEETYELLEAIEGGDPLHIREELGDVLLQVVFQAEIARERGRFDLDDVARGVADKLVRRHPHVFGDGDPDVTAEESLARWEAIKRQERADKAEAQGEHAPVVVRPSALDGVPTELPALLAAYRISQKAAGVGFDWPDVGSALLKVDEEVSELREAIDTGVRGRIAEELGDLLFILSNLARKLGVDPEDTLRLANRKFRRRFDHIEARLDEDGRTAADSDLEEMDRYWEEAKTRERGP